ncbi:ribosomal protein L7/L12 [Micromonospora sp. NPDC006766]|uniref:ribosomal protein L7/L12 n=1 Tax=Micromonospora sp. NPDC006766 TaxID=3154778 RepID=UPI0033F6D366
MEWISLLVLLAVLVQLMVSGSGRRAAADRQARQLAAVERKLNLIMDHLGIREPEPGAPARVLEELMAGRKLQAIKVYRDATQVGLKDAKDAVELLARRYGLE